MEKKEKDNTEKRFYYRADVDSALGKCISRYYKEVARVEERSARLVKSSGAVDGIPDITNEAGGLCGFIFKNCVLPEELWETDSFDDGTKVHYPKVSVSTDVIFADENIKPGSRAYLTDKDTGKKIGEAILSKDVFPFNKVRNFITFANAAKMAGIDVRHKDAHVVVIRSRKGEDIDPVIVKEAEEDVRMVETAMASKRFFLRTLVFGKDKPVMLYRNMMALPVIPVGTLGKVLMMDMEDPNEYKIPVCFKYDGNYYVSTSKECKHDLLASIDEQTFNVHRNLLKNKLKGVGQNTSAMFKI